MVKVFTGLLETRAMGFDESRYARIVADHFGTEHHELVGEAANISVLDDMAEFLDEPLAHVLKGFRPSARMAAGSSLLSCWRHAAGASELRPRSEDHMLSTHGR